MFNTPVVFSVVIIVVTISRNSACQSGRYIGILHNVVCCGHKSAKDGMFSAFISMHESTGPSLTANSSFGLPNDGSINDDELEVRNVASSGVRTCIDHSVDTCLNLVIDCARNQEFQSKPQIIIHARAELSLDVPTVVISTSVVCRQKIYLQ